MKNTIRNTLFILTGLPTFAYAAADVGNGGNFLWLLFIGFFALIVVFQLVPAIMLFSGLLKGIFSRDHKVEKHL